MYEKKIRTLPREVGDAPVHDFSNSYSNEINCGFKSYKKITILFIEKLPNRTRLKSNPQLIVNEVVTLRKL